MSGANGPHWSPTEIIGATLPPGRARRLAGLLAVGRVAERDFRGRDGANGGTRKRQGSAGVDTDDAGLTMHPEQPRGCPALCLGLRAEAVEESQDACEAIGE